MDNPQSKIHVDVDADAEHLIDEAVSAVYRASPTLALTLARDALAARLQQFISGLENEVTQANTEDE